MISRAAIREYRERELVDYDWLKALPPRVVDRMIADMDPPIEFVTEPFLHQKICTLITATCPRFFLQLDMGTGKSKVALDAIRYRARVRGRARVLVLVEFLTTIDEWTAPDIGQCAIHAPDIPCVPLHGSSTERLARIEALRDVPIQICVLNYAGLVAMTTYREERYNKKKRKNEKVTVIDKKRVADLAKIFDGFVLDESTAVMNHESMSHRVCRQLTKSPEAMVLLLSGTPFGRDPQALWSQFFIADRGETLGPTLGLFRAAYFNEKEDKWRGVVYEFDEKYNDELHRVMRHGSIWYSIDAQLPPQVHIKRHALLPPDAEKMQQDIIREVRAAGQDVSLLQSVFTRLRQVASGFVRVKDEAGTTVDVPLPKNVKLDMLMAIIDALPNDAKLVVFHEFIYSGALISRELKTRKIGHGRLWSGTKDRVEQLTRFREDPTCRVLVLNNTLGSKGLNLQVANYTVFYETPTSVINRRQAEKRTHRHGQAAHRVFYYDLIVRGSVDAKLLSYQEQGRDLFDALVKGEETWSE